MSKNKRNLSVSVVAVLALAVAWLRFGRTVSVPVGSAATATLPQRVFGPGIVQARVPVQAAGLASRIAGQVFRTPNEAHLALAAQASGRSNHPDSGARGGHHANPEGASA